LLVAALCPFARVLIHFEKRYVCERVYSHEPRRRRKAFELSLSDFLDERTCTFNFSYIIVPTDAVPVGCITKSNEPQLLTFISFSLHISPSSQHRMSLVYQVPLQPSQSRQRRHGLYVGGKQDAKDEAKLRQRYGVTHILNMTPTKESNIQVGQTS
jgi:hypothetical protein